MKNLRGYGTSQVLDIDGRVELAGQGGWRTETLDVPAGVALADGIGQAFDNVAMMLGHVGLGWADLVHVNSYHVPEPDGTILAATAAMARQFEARTPQAPVWTCLAVVCLGDRAMRVEIRVTAYRHIAQAAAGRGTAG